MVQWLFGCYPAIYLITQLCSNQTMHQTGHGKAPDFVGNFWLEIPAGTFLELLTLFKATIGAKHYILCLYLGMSLYIINHWHTCDFKVAGRKYFFMLCHQILQIQMNG